MAIIYGNDTNADTLSGTSKNDTIYSFGGNDIIDGGAGKDSLVGGNGNDTYYVDNSKDKTYEKSGEGIDIVFSTISWTLANNVENLYLEENASKNINGKGNGLNNTITGNSRNNYLYGLAGDDTLIGNDGDDTLDGGAGNDSLIGGNGNDTYIIDSAFDIISEDSLALSGIDTVITALSNYTLGNNLENLVLSGSLAIDGTGNSLDNYILGNKAINSLYGGSGNDTLNGGGGSDTLSGGDGNDTYIINSTLVTITETLTGGIDTVMSSVNYTLGNSVNVENLTLTGSAIKGFGNDQGNYLAGNSKSNYLSGGGGNDTVCGSRGTDSLVGGDGNDTYIVDNSKNKIYEYSGGGTDLVYASVSYTLSANVEKLILTGTTNINAGSSNTDVTIIGNNGKNTIKSGNGNDTVDGGAGNDTIYGGYGNDFIQGSSTNIVDNDYLYGEYGNDTLDGGWGVDNLAGGYGNDTYIVDNPYDKITEIGSDIDTVYAYSTPYALGSGVENLVLKDTVTTITPSGESQCIVYGDPIKWGNYLDYWQGDNGFGYEGTCGIVSAENVLIKAGKIAPKAGYSPADTRIDYTEEGIVNYAINKHYCWTTDDTNDPRLLGATDQGDQANILSGYGMVQTVGTTSASTVDIYTSDQTDYDLAYYVQNNYGVILELNAEILWGTSTTYTGNDHAVAVTGVAYKKSDNSLAGFYIVDSGECLKINPSQDAAEFISVDKLLQCVNGTTMADTAVSIAYTTYPVYSTGTGNSLNNFITGTTLANSLDGGSGNDTLCGMGGDDYFTGGTGNDSLVGGNNNDLYLFNSDDGCDTISDSGSGIGDGAGDGIFFQSNVDMYDIALFLNGNNLIIDYGSTAGQDQITIQDYSNNAHKIEELCAQDTDYYYLDPNTVITAIAQYCTGHSITGTINSEQKQDLETLITGAWTT